MAREFLWQNCGSTGFSLYIWLYMFGGKTLSLIVALLLISTCARAHHAMEVHYIVSEEAIVSHAGMVKNFSFMDPHSYLVVTVEENGESRDWVLEGQSRVILTRAGWRLDMLKAGTPVRFSAFPSRSGEPAGRLLLLEVDGQQYCSDRCDLFEIVPSEVSLTPDQAREQSASLQLAESF